MCERKTCSHYIFGSVANELAVCMEVSMTINYEYETETILSFDYKVIMEKVVNEVLDYEQCPYEVELNIVLTDNEEIHSVNKEYRQIDAPTDVLSFPMIDYENPSDFSHVEEEDSGYFNPDTGELILGDIMLSVDKVLEQAKEYGHSEERELAFLTAHSMLHLCGYDHMEEDDRVIMEQKQKNILEALSITR